MMTTAFSKMLALLAAVCIPAACLALPASAASAPQIRLRDQMARLDRLCQALSQREQEAQAWVRRLEMHKSELAGEIRNEAKRINVEDYPCARQSLRIAGNLKLIARILVYQQALEAEIAALQRSGAELRYLYHRADDDLQMLSAVDNLSVEELISEIEARLPPYEIQAQRLFLTIEGMAPPPAQTIWQTLMPRP
jgi:hypothetical protein